MDKVEDLNTQLEAIGGETRTVNPIVLSVLSTTTVSMSMELKNEESKTAGKMTSNESNGNYM